MMIVRADETEQTILRYISHETVPKALGGTKHSGGDLAEYFGGTGTSHVDSAGFFLPKALKP